jgi:TetR/AcrR family transcriptional regulator of autoinduction and epiphytic fitness
MSNEKKSRVLNAGRGLFLRYGYKRVSMNDIAEAAGISRPALYLVFKNKEEIFKGAHEQWVDEKILEIEEKVATLDTPKEKLHLAFELGVVLPIEAMKASPELNELVECNFGFAQQSLNNGYRRFENAVERLLNLFPQASFTENSLTAQRAAHLLVSAVRGFKQTAETSEELRLLIDDCISLVLSSGTRS